MPQFTTFTINKGWSWLRGQIVMKLGTKHVIYTNILQLLSRKIISLLMPKCHFWHLKPEE